MADLEEFQVRAKSEGLAAMREAAPKPLTRKNLPHLMADLERQMREAADCLDFELAAALRDRLFEIREMSGLSVPAARPARGAPRLPASPRPPRRAPIH